MSGRPLSTYPKDRETLLKYAALIGVTWENESMPALEMAALVEAILTDEVRELAALVAERDALRKALEMVDADARHHLRSDKIDASLLRPDALAEVRRVLAAYPK